MLVRLRPSRKRADAGKEPDNRRETRTPAHCGILPSSSTFSQISEICTYGHIHIHKLISQNLQACRLPVEVCNVTKHVYCMSYVSVMQDKS